jgi:predicted phosphate transport protein (TIGR00153 family)
LVSLPGVTFSRKEGTIVKRMVDNVRLVRETEQALPSLVSAVADGDVAACLDSRNRIFELESRAAAVRRELSTLIAEGAFFGGVREDMLNLIGKIHDIADKAKDAARLITLARVTNPKAIEVLRSDDMKQFLANLDMAVVALQGTIEAFAIDRKTVIKRVHTVEGYEEVADTFKQHLLVALFEKSEGGIDPLTMILVRDFLFCADDVADRSEDASDVAIVLVAKGYG